MEVKFTQDNINFYLYELAKEIKKTMGRKADIKLIVESKIKADQDTWSSYDRMNEYIINKVNE